MEHKDTTHGNFQYWNYVFVWLGLLILTATTVTVAGLHLGKLSTLTAMIIATVKAGLVLSFFMHLKQEPLLLKGIVFAAVATLSVIMFLTFMDIWYR